MRDVASKWQGRDELMSAIADNELFIRFGNLPRNKRSSNHLTGKLEPGLSCYRAKANFCAESFELTGGGLSLAVLKAARGGYGRVNLLLRGEVAGVGGDGEPCIRRVKMMGNLKWDIQKCGFILVGQAPSKTAIEKAN